MQHWQSIGVKPMRHVITREKSTEEMKNFTTKVTNQLKSGSVRLINTLKLDNPHEETKQWLQEAITNIHKIMYKFGADIWGEQDQTQKTQK